MFRNKISSDVHTSSGFYEEWLGKNVIAQSDQTIIYTIDKFSPLSTSMEFSGFEGIVTDFIVSTSVSMFCHMGFITYFFFQVSKDLNKVSQNIRLQNINLDWKNFESDTSSSIISNDMYSIDIPMGPNLEVVEPDESMIGYVIPLDESDISSTSSDLVSYPTARNLSNNLNYEVTVPSQVFLVEGHLAVLDGARFYYYYSGNPVIRYGATFFYYSFEGGYY